MTEPLNLNELEVEDHPSYPAGYRFRSAQFGPTIGAARLGGSVYELDPGESVGPYHFEGVEEEWVIVLAGTPTLRDPEGEHELAQGDVVCFRQGDEGAHKLTNRSDSLVRVVMLSTMPAKELSVCVYPDSAKVSVWPWPGKRLRITDSVDYWDGET